MKKEYKNLILGIAGLGWIMLVIGAYYWGHKPFTPEVFLQVSVFTFRVGVIGLFTAVAGGIGRRVSKWVHLEEQLRSSEQAALGFGLMGVGYLFVGSIGLVSMWFGWGILIFLLIIMRKDIKTWCIGFWQVLPLIYKEEGLSRWMMIGAGIIFGLTFLEALAPPIAYDSLVYHLVEPQAYLQMGKEGYLDWLAYWGFPQLGEMLYTWGMSIGGAQTAAGIGWAMGMMTVIGIWEMMEKKFRGIAASVGVAAMLSGFSMTISLSWAYVDWMTALFGLGMLRCLLIWQATRNKTVLLTAGIFAGFALGIKYTAGVLLLAGGIYLVTEGIRKKKLYWKEILILGFSAVVVVSPWLVKNFIATGNPFYPMFLPAGAMTPLRLTHYQNPSVEIRWLDLLFLPWRATVFGFQGAGEYAASIGPLFLALGVIGIGGIRSGKGESKQLLRLAFVIGISGIVIWAIGSQVVGFLMQTRLYWGLFPAFAILAGAGYEFLNNLEIPNVRIGKIAGILIIVVFSFNIFEVGVKVVEHRSLDYHLGLLSEEEYLTENLGMHSIAMKAIQQLPESAKVLLLFETRSFYCQPKCRPDEILDRWRRDYAQSGTVETMANTWRAEGFTHLMVYDLGSNFLRDTDLRYPPEEWAEFDRLAEVLPVVERFGDIYTLYAVTQ